MWTEIFPKVQTSIYFFVSILYGTPCGIFTRFFGSFHFFKKSQNFTLLLYISGKVAFVDEVNHCTECHVCYEYQLRQCRNCCSSWAQFCPKCNNTSRTMCEVCGLDVSSWDSWTHSDDDADCSVHSISQLDIQVYIYI